MYYQFSPNRIAQEDHRCKNINFQMHYVVKINNRERTYLVVLQTEHITQ
jgi:hypothetical protein